MEHRIDPGHRMVDRIGIGQVALDLAHAQRGQRRVLATVETQDMVATFDQPATQRLAQKAATTGYQYFHRACSSRAAAQTASFSRPILAL